MNSDEAVEYLRDRQLPDSHEAWKRLLPVCVGSLFGCYFTQDWPDDYGSWENTAQAWMVEGDGDDPSARQQAIQELQRLLDLQIPDRVYRVIGGRFLNIEYWPDEDFNDWLRKVQQLIADAPPFPDPDPLTVEDLDRE